jgi:hypothetical protein
MIIYFEVQYMGGPCFIKEDMSGALRPALARAALTTSRPPPSASTAVNIRVLLRGGIPSAQVSSRYPLKVSSEGTLSHEVICHEIEKAGESDADHGNR